MAAQFRSSRYVVPLYYIISQASGYAGELDAEAPLSMIAKIRFRSPLLA